MLYVAAPTRPMVAQRTPVVNKTGPGMVKKAPAGIGEDESAELIQQVGFMQAVLKWRNYCHVQSPFLVCW